MEESVRHNVVPYPENVKLFREELEFLQRIPRAFQIPTRFWILPLCAVAELGHLDVSPGFILKLFRNELDSKSYHSLKMAVIRAFKENLDRGIFAIYAQATKRGRKRQLYKITEKGRENLRNWRSHMLHWYLAS